MVLLQPRTSRFPNLYGTDSFYFHEKPFKWLDEWAFEPEHKHKNTNKTFARLLVLALSGLVLLWAVLVTSVVAIVWLAQQSPLGVPVGTVALGVAALVLLARGLAWVFSDG